MRIGITGHQRLEDESQWPRVHADLTRIIQRVRGPVTGVTSLAIGADQLFAEIVIELGGTVEVVIPFKGYESTFKSGPSLENYRRLLASAVKVTTLPLQKTEEESYLAAGKLVAETTDKLIAIWDGKEAEGLGGTGDVVAYAKHIGTPVILIPVN